MSIVGNAAFSSFPRLQRLAQRLENPTRFPANMASQRYVRKRRESINSQLVQLIARVAEPVGFVTLIPNGWLVPAAQLDATSPRRLMEQIRITLYRAGLNRVRGWGFLVLDLEYVQRDDAFAFHVHGVATGDLFHGIAGLRSRPKFKRVAEDGEARRRSVQCKLIRPGEEARAVNYLIKTYHGTRHHHHREGRSVRVMAKTALPEARRSEYLAWISQWDIDDFVLSVHLFFSRSGLEISKSFVH